VVVDAANGVFLYPTSGRKRFQRQKNNVYTEQRYNALIKPQDVTDTLQGSQMQRACLYYRDKAAILQPFSRRNPERLLLH
jgi:hypothetical protein